MVNHCNLIFLPCDKKSEKRIKVWINIKQERREKTLDSIMVEINRYVYDVYNKKCEVPRFFLVASFCIEDA